MEETYYIEGEIGEIKFTGKNDVSFTIIPSQDYRRKEGDCEYALMMHVTTKGLLADNISMDDFKKQCFVCVNKALASQLSVLKVNRNVVRVERTEAVKNGKSITTTDVSIK